MGGKKNRKDHVFDIDFHNSAINYEKFTHEELLQLFSHRETN